MWLESTPTIEFRWLDGRLYNLKAMREIPVYDDFVRIDLRQGDMLDEISSREDIFGINREDFSYLLFEANVVKLTENKFNLSKLKEIRIPVVS
jgi:hypothetical protein